MNEEKLNNILTKYNFNQEGKEKTLELICKLYSNPNFQRHMQEDFPHHDNVL